MATSSGGTLLVRAGSLHNGNIISNTISPPPVSGVVTPRGSQHVAPGVVIGEGVILDKAPIGGILHKWVNYGRFWKLRWFILDQGVLSYYRMDGQEKISVIKEIQSRPNLRLIGDEAKRLLKKEKSTGAATGSSSSSGKTGGTVHLQVCTIRESQADDRKFYIYSGTKTLHLKAASKEERFEWLETIMACKNSYSMVPLQLNESEHREVEEIPVSLEKLRQRLTEAGVTENVITDCERIVRCDIVSVLETELHEERQRRQLLLNRVKHLEAEKVELETAVVQETQQGLSGRLRSFGEPYPKQADFGTDEGDGEPDDSEEDDVVVDEQDTDREDGEFDGEDMFFEAAEEFGRRKRAVKSNTEELPFGREIQARSPMQEPKVEKELLDMDLVGFNYPKVERRVKLPDPTEKEKPVSLWSIIKDNVGKDLSRVCLPVYFNEPISTLQKCFEEMEYSWLLDKAYEYGRRGNHLMRMIYVSAFAVSGYACTLDRSNKPFNPLLGETYEALWEDKGVRFISEKVSHHPTIVACHAEGRGWRFYADSNLKSKFWGPSIQLDPLGVLTLEFEDGEMFEWSKVTTSIYNVILGKLYVDHYGTMKINGNRGLSSRLKFKERSIMDRNPHQVRGFVQNSEGEKLATLIGKWDQHISYIMGDLSKHQQKEGAEALEDAVLLWQRSPPPPYPTRYNLTSFAIKLNEITPDIEGKLAPTDSRLRPDQRALENGQFDFSNTEKLRLEQRQRQARKEQETGWRPQWFRQAGPHNTFQYQGGYWEARENGDWSMCKRIFAPSLTDQS